MIIILDIGKKLDFPGGSGGKESACDVGDLGLILGSGRFPGKGNSYPLQYSCLETSMDRVTPHNPYGHKKLDMTERLILSLFSG